VLKYATAKEAYTRTPCSSKQNTVSRFSVHFGEK